ncbi:MAG: sigma-70 family RNA polymerase sigma factor [Planctomycetia bacterium]|nr:sigma-70 family RNA polymerase sigma factor [Planctomycetia bacterium]
MPTESTRPLARQLLRVVLGTTDVPDRELLARFVASRDEDAFAEIVRRHGPMVLAACRRVTGRPHDAEDAFQAAFLVLARRAAHVTRPELLANWLYGVACRTALEARAARRRAEEHVVPVAPEPAAPSPPDDTTELRRVIDEELAKLPDKYRAAVVLCDLEGLPRATAAAQLRIPEGTLSSRLAHARKVLAERLTRRGITASATAIAAALGSDVVAVTVSRGLAASTAHAAVEFAPGGTVPLVLSPSVSSLTDGVLKTMLVNRLRLMIAVGVLSCGLLGLGAVGLAQFQNTPQQPSADQPLWPTVADSSPAPTIIYVDSNTGQRFVLAQPAPKKVPAKGIEDDDVPYASFPSQAVVRLEDGKLIVRQRGHYYEPVTQKVGENAVTSYQMKSGVNATTHDPADVAVFDMKGNRLSPKAWKELFKTDVHVLVSHDGKLPNPRELALFKQDTLVVVLPSPVPNFAPKTVVPGYRLPPTPSVPMRPNSTPAPAFPPPPVARPSTTPAPVPLRPVGPGSFAPTPAAPVPVGPGSELGLELPENVRGSVLDVNKELVRISIGIDAGLEAGVVLDVYRVADKPKYLGTLVVKTVKPKEAVAEFKPARKVPLDKLREDELPRKGDSVGRLTPTPDELPQPSVPSELIPPTSLPN